MNVFLRDTQAEDLPAFFRHQHDRVASRMAAFTSEKPPDLAEFDAHWQRVMADPQITLKTIVVDEAVAGHILCHSDFGVPEISYWIDRSLWGRGVATAALTAFLTQVTTRPLYARVVADNLGSIRVLDRCGFVKVGEEKSFAAGRGAEVVEWILKRG